MFGIQPLELLVLALVGFLLFGEKLPDLARDAARMLHRLRTMADAATKGLRDELGPDYADLDVRDLHPKRLVQKHIVDVVWQEEQAAAAAAAGAAKDGATRSREAPRPAGEVTAFDGDAT